MKKTSTAAPMPPAGSASMDRGARALIATHEMLMRVAERRKPR